jgi:hypothetical protein
LLLGSGIVVLLRWRTLLLILEGWGGGWGGLADAGEGEVDFFLGEVFGAEEGDALFDGRVGYGRVLED